MAIDREEYRQSVLKNIENFGFHTTSVMGSNPDEISYTYSTGIQETASKPDIIIFGLSPSLSHTLINIYYNRIKSGESFEAGVQYSSFLKESTIVFDTVPKNKIDEYMLCVPWIYGDKQHEAYQLLYPDDDGNWPWQDNVEETFRRFQPVLAR